MNCVALSARFIRDFPTFIQQIPDLISFAKSHMKISLENINTIDICSSCARFLGQINEFSVHIAVNMIRSLLELNNQVDEAIANEVEIPITFADIKTKSYDLFATICWALFKTNQFTDVESCFNLGLVDLIFSMFHIATFVAKKFAVIFLSALCSECCETSKHAEHLLELGIIQIIAPFAKLNEKPLTQELVITAIVSLHQASEAEDLLGDAIEEFLDSEDEKVAQVAQEFVNQLEENE